MGTRHLYWIITGPSFAVFKETISCTHVTGTDLGILKPTVFSDLIVDSEYSIYPRRL